MQNRISWTSIATNILVLLLIGVALAFCILRLSDLKEQRFDVEIYYFAIDKFNNLGMLYHRGDGNLTTPEVLFRPSSPVYKFPPLYLAWIVPLHHWFNIHDFYMVYCAWQLLFYLFAAFFLVLMLKPYANLKMSSIVTPLIFLLSFPFYEAIRATSVELLLLCGLLATYLVSERFPRCAGIMLAYLAMLKIYPAFMLFYFLARRQWKVIDGFFYGGLFFLMSSVAIFGLQEHFYYLTTVLPVLLNEEISLKDDNVNVIAAFKYYLDQEQINRLFLIWKIIVLCMLAAVCAYKRENTARNSLLIFIFFMIVMQLLLPNYGVSYQPYLQVPAVVTLVFFWQRRQFLLFSSSVVMALMLTLNPEWLQSVLRHPLELLIYNSDVFLSQPAEYWYSMYQEKGSVVFREISPLAYRLYWLTHIPSLLLPTYFFLVLYLLLTPKCDQMNSGCANPASAQNQKLICGTGVQVFSP